MKQLFLFAFVLLLAPFGLQAQILQPVHWQYSKQKMGDHQYIVHLKATIDPGWHIYAQDAGEGPVPTRFTFAENDKLVFKGKTRAVGKLHKTFDKAFNSVLQYYEDSVDFVQYVEAKAGASAVEGTLEFMVCNDEQCLPPKEMAFKIAL